jgi:hypothetical protein
MKSIVTVSDDTLAKKILNQIKGADEIIFSQMLGIHPIFTQTNAKVIEMYTPRLEHYDKQQFHYNGRYTSKYTESQRAEAALKHSGHGVFRQFYPFQLNQQVRLNKYRMVDAAIAQSNHDKNYAFVHNGKFRMIVTSSNLELKNPEKIEVAVILDITQPTFEMQQQRNQWMYEQSTRFYEESENWENYASIDITGRLWDAHWNDNVLMGGPGIHGGPMCLVEKMMELVDSADEFVQIHTQHFTGNFDGYDEWFSAIKRARRRGVSVSLIVQSNGVNYASEVAGTRALELMSDWSGAGCKYFINRKTHCKCVLTDAGGVTMTLNLSSTPFNDKILTLNNLKTTEINSVHRVTFHLAEAFTAVLLPNQEAISLSEKLMVHYSNANSQSGSGTVCPANL